MAPFKYTNTIEPDDLYNLEEKVAANIRLVVEIARRFENNGLSLTDLISKGKSGLTRAFKGYDESKGFDFIDYATWHIRQSIVRAIVENQPQRPIPLTKIGLISKVQNSFLKPDHFFQREPAIREMESIKEFRMKVTSDDRIANNRYSEA